MKGFIVYPTYYTLEDQTYIQLFGRLENGQSFVTINKFNPYFYVKKSNAKLIPKDFTVEDTKLTNFAGDKVVKVFSSKRADLNNLVKDLHKEKEIETYEADLKPHYRFLIEHNLLNSIEIDGDYEPSEKIDRVYQNPKIKPSDFSPKFKVISIDIETGKPGGLFCIGIYAENYKKNFMITDKKLKDTVSCKDERDCLTNFKEEIIKLDPDIITGWNVIDFDFVYLRDLYRKHNLPFDIGRTNQEPKIRVEGNFFRSSSIDIPGRHVLDGLNLIKDPFIKDSPFMRHAKFESFSLESVSQEILGNGKLLKGSGRHQEIEELYNEGTEKSLQKLVNYNLMDCQLVYEILEKTKIVDLALERIQLTGMSLDRLTASIAAFDSLYIREAKAKGFVSPTTHFTKKEERITGGFVQSLKPGIYNNVLVFDFKSLYPSIIRTFNIDPASHLEKKAKGAIESPNKTYFKNNEGILPIIIERLHKERERAKKEKRNLSSHTIKIIMNSFFGVLASPNCRYFSLDVANAITHFGQFIIKLTAKEIEKDGYKVIYSDTDSVFVETNLEKNKANKLGEKIQEQINSFYDKYVKDNYSRKSVLELEFEKQYISMAIPKTRGKETTVAAKKRYAGLLEKNGKEEIEITGLEAIRGDWTQAAQEFQVELLDKLFHKEPVDKFIKDYITKVEKGKMDEKLVYRKSIRKDLDKYVKTTPPHVKAARKLDRLDSKVIEYYITTDGPEPIQKLKHSIDYKHYLDKQIKPIAQQILNLLGQSFDELVQGSKQAKLF